MKGVLLIIDGLGDLPIPGLDRCTPLEAAATPVLNGFASHGRYGLVDPIAPGVLPNTHSGAGMLLGLKPEQADLLRRGPVEAAGRGLSLAPGDVAMRANFATLAESTEGLEVIDRRAGRIRSGVRELSEALNAIDPGEGLRAGFWPTEQHRGVLVISGDGLDDRITDTDPGDHASSGLWRACRAEHPGAQRTADAINRFSREAHRVLSTHPVNRWRREQGLLPANGILVRGAGHPLPLDNLVSDHSMNATVISGCNTVQGLGRLLGFRVIEDSRFTADLDTDLEAKVATALAETARTDLVFVHIKAPDICAHDCNPVAKRDFITAIDAALAPLAVARVAVAVAADHTTDSNTGRHTPDPVPALIFVPGESAPGPATVKFGETACRSGALPRLDAHHFLLDFLRVLEAGRL